MSGGRGCTINSGTLTTHDRLKGFADYITSISFTSDEKFAFIGDKSGKIFLYHTANNKLQKICEIPSDIDSNFGLDSLVVSHDSSFLVAQDRD